jgi:hypothetical protein
VVAVIYSDQVELRGDRWEVVERSVAKLWEKDGL